MTIKLYHHPFSRAAGTVWVLEEVGQPYELEFVDLMKGAHKVADFTKTNPMGKLPTLVDGDAVVTEAAAIALYLADRYSAGKLAPKLDDPRRGTYLRWSFYAPSVIEPGCAAHASKWEFRPSSVGWGTWDEMIRTIDGALAGDYVLGNEFSMADVIFGGTVRFMTMFKMLDASPAIAKYLERLSARPAFKRAEEINTRVMKEHDLKLPGS
ncbi:MAG TPA: glutathione S-transferase family protein [Kofleriaceae bacterium]|nr:glutathione S-transferase family protein [Kofleriaceae bacterium]